MNKTRLWNVVVFVVCCGVMFVAGRLSVETAASRPANTTPQRDVRTEIAAYDKASELFRASELGRGAGQIAAYSPESVRLLAENLYAVTVVYEGRNNLGNLTALNVRMNIRCEKGLCFFTTAE